MCCENRKYSLFFAPSAEENKKGERPLSFLLFTIKWQGHCPCHSYYHSIKTDMEAVLYPLVILNDGRRFLSRIIGLYRPFFSFLYDFPRSYREGKVHPWYTRPFDRASVTWMHYQNIRKLRPGYLRSLVLLWKHLFLHHIISFSIRRNGILYLWYLRHLRVRGRHLFRFISRSIVSSMRSILFRGICEAQWFFGDTSFFILSFIKSVIVYLHRAGHLRLTGWSSTIRGRTFRLARGRERTPVLPSRHTRTNHLFGGHLLSFILRSVTVVRETVSLLKKRMHRQGRTCGSCACRNGSDEIIRGRVGLTHKPCFKGIRFSKLAHIFALL